MKVVRSTVWLVFICGLVGFGAIAVAGGDRSERGSAAAPPVAPQPDYASDRSDSRGLAGEGPVVWRGRSAVQLIARPSVVDQGSTLGLEIRNRGEVALGYGYGEVIQRRKGGRWVRAHDVYHRRFSAWILPLLILQPGVAAGPDLGVGLPMQAVLRRGLKPGLYRVLKDFLSAKGRTWRDERLWAPVRFRVKADPKPAPPLRQLTSNVGVRRNGETAARLWLDRRVIRAGEILGLAVENLGSTTVTFDEGGVVARWTRGAWRASARKPGRNRIDRRSGRNGDFRLKPGEIGGPAHGEARDVIRVPKGLRPGRYAVTKEIFATPVRRHAVPAISIDAWFRIVK